MAKTESKEASTYPLKLRILRTLSLSWTFGHISVRKHSNFMWESVVQEQAKDNVDIKIGKGAQTSSLHLKVGHLQKIVFQEYL